ncbi:MAG: TIGR04283 family arsenosugar biosynthesis glycosyltransferase [Thermoanaerobaculaceae bacterium]|nr:TIGR04283 family arsenosugar biosynthesis glycosyltransferase [Thermoanaerobaculaceae bacterium]TAM53135.1 MAG: glycosyltransferase [Acidobacteriota bacterium]
MARLPATVPGGPGLRSLAVVVPTLDEERAIGACLAAVGDDQGIEVAVSDGGSADATVAAARRERPGVRVVTGPPGRGAQLNRGAAAVAADAYVFVHADCRLPAGWAAAVRGALADPGVALGCFRLHTEPARPGAGAAARWWWRLLDLRSRGLGLPYGDQALFVRREVFAAVGGFPPIPLMEDVEFVRRCLRHGRLARLPLAVRTTARRFARRPLRARLCTATFPLLFRLGVSPHRLARWYGDVR